MPNRNRYKNRQQTGFTLIELLVVISIITLLSSVLIASFKTARSSAYLARLEEDAHQIQNQLDIIRNDKNEVMGQIIGNWCRACEFVSYEPLNQQPVAEADNDGDWKLMGFPNGAPRDPWGNPYLFDANEYDPQYPIHNPQTDGTCGRMDTIFSSGPDGIFQGTSWYVGFIPTPGQIYPIPGSDDYAVFMTLFECPVPYPPG